MNSRCAWLVALFATAVVNGLVADDKSGADHIPVPPDLVIPSIDGRLTQSLVDGDWSLSLRLLDQRLAEKLNTIERYVKGHACIIASRSNETVALFHESDDPRDLLIWLKWTESFAAAHPDAGTPSYLHADALARTGQYQQAIEILTREAQKPGIRILALNARAVCYANLAKWDEALVDLSDAAALKPDLAEIHLNRGTINIRQSHGAQGALKAFDRALKISPDYVLAKIGRASALFGLGKLNDALLELEKCKNDPVSGHLAVVNAAVVREYIQKLELAGASTGKAGVSIDQIMKIKAQADAHNHDVLMNELGNIALTTMRDTWHDLVTVGKPAMQTFKAVQEFTDGKFAAGWKDASSVFNTIGQNNKNLVNTAITATDLQAKASEMKWKADINQLHSLSTSGKQGGVESESLARGYVDEGQWPMLARFTLQYPAVPLPPGAATRPATREVRP